MRSKWSHRLSPCEHTIPPGRRAAFISSKYDFSKSDEAGPVEEQHWCLHKTRRTRTPALWDTPRRPMITHTNDSHQIQGWGEYYSGTRLAQNDKHEYTKNIVLQYYSSTDFPVLVLVWSILAPALIRSQVKTRQSQSYKFWKIAKNTNF